MAAALGLQPVCSAMASSADVVGDASKVAVAVVVLYEARVKTLVGQRETAGTPQHSRVDGWPQRR